MSLWKVVRPAAWAGFHAVTRVYLALRRREYRYIFILGHVRSGSTLLAHILASHPDFVGAGETHTDYRTPADLPKLVGKTCELLHRPVLRESYIVDQINHDHVANDVLLSEQVYRCIILLREPEATLKSMMNLSIWQEKQALKLYVSRLGSLVQYALLLRERALLVEYDDLLDHTDRTLAALTRFLGLYSPLSANYATHRMTGRIEGYGDPSDNIKVGHIIRTPNHEVAISQNTLTVAARAYNKCRGQLQTAVFQPLPVR